MDIPLDMAKRLADLQSRESEIEAGGGPKRIERQHQSGRYFVRERLGLLLDPGTFVELDKFVQHRSAAAGKTSAPDDGIVTGYGHIDGRLVYVYADDFTVLGGSLGEMHARKRCKILDLALRNQAPLIGLNDSGGARIQDGVDSMQGYGEIFYLNSRLSGVVPQISAIVGPCAGGTAYSAALTDFIIMVDRTSYMFITGPAVIKAAIGEDVPVEEVGGARVHNERSGVSHFVVADEDECYRLIRTLLSYLPLNNRERPPVVPCSDDPVRLVEELLQVVPVNPKLSYDMKMVIGLIVDHDSFLEVHSGFAANIITGFARLNGQAVGIVANQPSVLVGCIDINASDKAARFIRFCDAFNIPLVTLVDVPGFLPGTEQEFGGIIRHGAKMLYAYSEATVPKVTLIIRKAYGGAYNAMCGKDLGTDMLLAWPIGEVAVMGPEGAANIIFRTEIQKSENPEETRKQKIAEYKEEFLNPYVGAQRGLIDRVILPQNSRKELIQALESCRNKQDKLPYKKHGNLPL